jgi:hypothetical protein
VIACLSVACVFFANTPTTKISLASAR